MDPESGLEKSATAFHPATSVPPQVGHKISVFMFFGTLAIVCIHTRPVTAGWGTINFHEFPMDVQHFTILYLTEYFCRFAVPMFFTISGYLICVHKGSDVLYFQAWRRISGRLQSLVIPFYIWNMVAPVTVFVFDLVVKIEHKDFLSLYKQHLYMATDLPYAIQFWYVRDLFVFACLSPAIVKLFRISSSLLLWIAALMWTIGVFSIPGETLLHYPPSHLECLSQIGFAHFTIGAHIALSGANVEIQARKEVALLLFASWCLFGMSLTVKAFHDTKETMSVHVLTNVCSSYGVFALWFAYDHIEAAFTRVGALPYLLRASKLSMWVYCAHEPMASCVGNHLRILFPDHLLLAYLAWAPTWFCILLAAGAYLSKHSVGVFALLTGGRGVREECRPLLSPRCFRPMGGLLLK